MSPPKDPKDASAAEGGRGDERSEAGEVKPPAKKPRAAAKPKAAAADKADKPKAAAADKPKAGAKPKAAAKPEVAAETKPKAAAKPKPKSAAKPKDEPKAAEETTPAEVEKAASEEAARSKPVAKDETSEKPATKPPGRKRDQPRKAQPGEAPVLVRAQARYVRTSARKARLVCDHIRGKDVEQARAILSFTPRGAAKPWKKLLESAIANAEHNHELVGDELKIASVHADEGPTLKRFRPRAMGRATRIRKRTSHLTITLTPKE
jgi:ribosomal protein L22